MHKGLYLNRLGISIIVVNVFGMYSSGLVNSVECSPFC